MLAVIYRVKIKPGSETTYQAAFHKMATFLRAERGAIGSCLHQADNGWFYVYSRWPDPATRARSWPQDPDQRVACLPIEMVKLAEQMRDCVDEKLAEIELQVIDDLLT